jgi:hypothetical protein
LKERTKKRSSIGPGAYYMHPAQKDEGLFASFSSEKEDSFLSSLPSEG